MVELQMEDFGEILRWFNHKYDEVDDKGLNLEYVMKKALLKDANMEIV